MTALLASMFSLVAGLLLGAAIQRWGDGTLATEHHTKPLPHPEMDLGSSYGALLAQRDRLIASGVDPDDLLLPDRPL